MLNELRFVQKKKFIGIILELLNLQLQHYKSVYINMIIIKIVVILF